MPPPTTAHRQTDGRTHKPTNGPTTSSPFVDCFACGGEPRNLGISQQSRTKERTKKLRLLRKRAAPAGPACSTCAASAQMRGFPHPPSRPDLAAEEPEPFWKSCGSWWLRAGSFFGGFSDRVNQAIVSSLGDGIVAQSEVRHPSERTERLRIINLLRRERQFRILSKVALGSR